MYSMTPISRISRDIHHFVVVTLIKVSLAWRMGSVGINADVWEWLDGNACNNNIHDRI